MNAPEKPSNVSVYVKPESVMPPGIVGVQFGLGHVCCARKSASVGAVTESEGTVSLPFVGESSPVVLDAVKLPWCCPSDGFPPALMQTTVAEYVALKSAVASVLPTPASSYSLHVTVRPLTVQLGVPVWTCVPAGAAVGSKVVAARAAGANKPTTSVDNVVIIPTRFIILMSSVFQSGEI